MRWEKDLIPTHFDIMEENDVELYLAASNEDLYDLAQNMVNQAPTGPEPVLNANRELQVNVHRKSFVRVHVFFIKCTADTFYLK